METTGQRQPRIAVFDSGVGGLTVVAAAHAALPGLHVRFLGDTARLPYGSKSASTVERYALQATAHLARGDIDALVVACNTASACALPALRAMYPFPVLGVIDPGAQQAVLASVSGHIGVIGTERTVASGAYAEAIAKLRPDAVVHAKATPLLVSLAEEGWFDHPATEAALQTYLGPFLSDPDVSKIDTLVLGCTHYPVFKPLLSQVLRQALGRDIALVDSAQAVTQQLIDLFPQAQQGQGQIELYATDSLDRFARVGGLFFPVYRAQLGLVDL